MTDEELDALTDTDTDLARYLPMLSVHPDGANRQDIAEIAAELMNCRCAIVQLRRERDAFVAVLDPADKNLVTAMMRAQQAGGPR